MTVLCFISLLFYGFVVQTNGQFLPHTDPNLLIENIVKENGYTFELHHVTTEDGYILALHRIPSNSKDTQNRRVVLIMHGLLGCSADWLVTGQNRSIAYLLSDDGYDVWLGNSRGTTNSKNHTKLSLESSKFWDFSWHEMGIYDLPAMIDYILNQTGQKQLFYIGFSQGTTQFWILMSLKPEYNKKIKLMSALAPVAYLGDISGILRPLHYLLFYFKKLFKYTGYFEMLSNSDEEKMITYNYCRDFITAPICDFIISSIGGFSDGEVDRVHLADYLQFAPAGCSVKQFIHYSMIAQNPGHFRPYDYGALRNFLIYGQFMPPEYPLENITAPVILYNGMNDFLARPNDVELLQKKLLNVEKYTAIKPLSHFDFVYGKNIRNLVYIHLIQKMNLIP